MVLLVLSESLEPPGPHIYEVESAVLSQENQVVHHRVAEYLLNIDYLFSRYFFPLKITITSKKKKFFFSLLIYRIDTGIICLELVLDGVSLR